MSRESVVPIEPPAPETERAADHELVRRLLARDRAAFERLVDQHHGSMLRLALAYVHRPEVAEELVQETWVSVLSKLATFEFRSSLKAWIFRILTNAAKTRASREARFVPFSNVGPPEGDDEVDPSRFDAEGMWSAPPRPWSDDAESRLLRKEAMGVLARALDELPPNQRAVVVLRDVEGVEPADICNMLEISESNQRVLLHRGRTRLRRALEAYGLSSESPS